MPRQKIDIVNNEIYHICYRAVGDSVIFKNNNDYYRGIFSLYEFNNIKPVLISIRRRDRLVEKKKEKLYGVGDHTISNDKRDKLVEIIAFCFMPNHLHLLLKQIKNNGISQFMRKLGGGYANYFNAKYERRGHLFNQFKAIHIKDDNQLHNVVTYIHCNPISLIQFKWKEEGIDNPQKAINFLEKEYRWSSLWDYCEKPNFSSVTSRSFLIDLIGKEGMEQEIKNWIEHKAKLKEITNMHSLLFLE